jgi:hypothetical protein
MTNFSLLNLTNHTNMAMSRRDLLQQQEDSEDMSDAAPPAVDVAQMDMASIIAGFAEESARRDAEAQRAAQARAQQLRLEREARARARREEEQRVLALAEEGHGLDRGAQAPPPGSNLPILPDLERLMEMKRNTEAVVGPDFALQAPAKIARAQRQRLAANVRWKQRLADAKEEFKDYTRDDFDDKTRERVGKLLVNASSQGRMGYIDKASLDDFEAFFGNRLGMPGVKLPTLANRLRTNNWEPVKFQGDDQQWQGRIDAWIEASRNSNLSYDALFNKPEGKELREELRALTYGLGRRMQRGQGSFDVAKPLTRYLQAAFGMDPSVQPGAIARRIEEGKSILLPHNFVGNRPQNKPGRTYQQTDEDEDVIDFTQQAPKPTVIDLTGDDPTPPGIVLPPFPANLNLKLPPPARPLPQRERKRGFMAALQGLVQQRDPAVDRQEQELKRVLEESKLDAEMEAARDREAKQQVISRIAVAAGLPGLPGIPPIPGVPVSAPVESQAPASNAPHRKRPREGELEEPASKRVRPDDPQSVWNFFARQG